MMPTNPQQDRSSGRIKLSICIPTYNRAEYLGAAIASVIEQINLRAEPEEIEIVVCDNHSTDNTAIIVAQIARDFPNLRYVERDVNVGCDRNIVEVCELSTGEYFWILGSDDTLPPGAIDTVMRAIDETQADLILGDANDCDVAMNVTGYLKFLKCEAREFCFDHKEDVTYYLQSSTMTASLFGYLSSMVFKRSTWDKLPLARYTLGSAYVQVFRALDIVFHPHSRLAYIAKSIANNRRNNCNYKAEFGEIQRYLIDMRMFRVAIDEYFSSDLQIRNLFKKFVRGCFGRMAHEKIRTGVAVMDELLIYFEDDDVAIPAINHWERHPVVERAYRRFQQNGIEQLCFANDAILHIGHRQEGSAILKPMNKQAIGVEHGYSGYNGVSLPFESTNTTTLYVSGFFPTKHDITNAIREWWRVLREDGYLVITNTCGANGQQHVDVSAARILTQLEATLPAGAYQILHCAQSFPDSNNKLISDVDIVIRKNPQENPNLAAAVSVLVTEAIQAHGAGNAEQAAKLALQVLKQDERNTAALQLLGLIAYQKNEHIDAICYFADAIKVDSSLADAFLNMGCAYAAIGGNAEAMQCFSAVLALRPNSTVAEANLNIVRSSIALHAEQRQRFLQVLMTHPQLAAAQDALSKMLNRSISA